MFFRDELGAENFVLRVVCSLAFERAVLEQAAPGAGFEDAEVIEVAVLTKGLMAEICQRSGKKIRPTIILTIITLCYWH